MTMKLSLLPVLVGVSLAGGAALGVLYLLMKKDDEEDIVNPPGRRLQTVTTSKMVTKIVPIPKESIGIVIGKGGCSIREVQEQTGTKIKMKEEDTADSMRMCVITGTAEGTIYAESLIQKLIRNQPLITTTDIRVPQSACGRIIGRQGENIRLISQQSGAKIDVENSTGNSSNFGDRRITLKGSAEQINKARLLISEKVQEDATLRQQYEAGAKNRTPRRDPKTPMYLKDSGQKDDEEAAISDHNQRLVSTSSDGMMEVYVSAVESPDCFWVQVLGPSAVELDQLHERMTEYYSNDANKAVHAIENLRVGMFVAAPFMKDDKYYRCRVMSISLNEYAPDESVVDLYYLDYGDSQEAPVKMVFELASDFLRMEFQAIECKLARVKPIGSEWTEEASDLFEELTYNARWKSLMCCIDGYETDRVRRQDTGLSGAADRVPVISLYDINGPKDINVADELVKNQFAVYVASPKKTKPEPASALNGSGSTASAGTSKAAENGSTSPTKPAADTSKAVKNGSGDAPAAPVTTLSS